MSIEFLQDGYEILFRKDGANMEDLTQDELLKTFLELSVYEDKGFLALLTNKKNVMLGYIAAHTVKNGFRPPALQIFCVYSSEKCPTTVQELVHELKEWAYNHGYKKLLARSYKKSGASYYMFTKMMRMKWVGMVYEHNL